MQKLSVIKDEFIFKKAPFEQCHASTIEETPNGLVASWFGGSHEQCKDVEIWVSRYSENNWSEPTSVAKGTRQNDDSYPTWNPVLFQIPNGPLMLFYKVGPNTREWWGMLKISSNGGEKWSKAYRLPTKVLGPIKNKPILLDDGTLICPSSTEVGRWQVHFEVTRDFGKFWQVIGPIDNPRGYNAIQPTILKHDDKVLQLLARSQNNYILSSWSFDGGITWNALKSINLPNPNAAIDAVTLKNGLHVLVYNHVKKSSNKWGGLRCPLNVAASGDGRDWNTILTLENNCNKNSNNHEFGFESDLHKSDINFYKYEFSYPAIIQTNDGLIHITYSWKRKRIKHIVVELK